VTRAGIFSYLIEASPDGHFVVVEGVFVYLNETALRMFGVSSYEGLTVADILHESEVERSRRNMALRMAGVLRGASTYRARRPDGSTFPIEVHAVPLDWEDRRGLHGVIRDITARRKMEEQLEHMERSTVISRLASGIAHDFNNLLAVIQSNAEVASRAGAGTPDFEGSLARIKAAVSRGGDKVRQIQQMGGLREDEGSFRSLYLNPIVEDVLELTRARWQDEAESAGVSYDVRWEPGSPPALAGSPGDLRAALVALVFNAVEAMPSGGAITIKTGETSDGEVLITVSDRGEGIVKEHLSRLCDAFFTTRPDRRMGLGLHLVQSVLERHGGRLEVDSTRGRGSTFALILPAAEEPPPGPPPPLRKDLIDGRSTPTVPEVDRPRTRGGRSILLIDDQADLVHVVRTILEGRGYSVDSALNGRDGVALADAARYSIILTDLGMPDISGWEVAAHVKEVQPETPVILMTGWAADIPPARLRENKISALLPKPFRSDQLLSLVKQVMSDSSKARR